MQTSFRNANGDLTAYALACGHTQRKLDGSAEIELFYEHGVYHIRGFDASTSERLFWEVTPKLPKAREYYRQGVRLAL